jgi:hypothetical protein
MLRYGPLDEFQDLARTAKPIFGYKRIEEEMGPHECGCPTSILDLLSPTDNRDAQNWRAACRRNALVRGNLPTPPPH